jgi:NitT/TauT family transport system permease protein
MNRKLRLVFGLAGVIALVVLWDGLGRAGFLDHDLFPPVTSMWRRFFELSMDGEFLKEHVGGSLYRLFAGSLVAVPLAVAAGFWLGLSDRAHAALNPLINFTLPLPKVAVFPLILAIFGIGDLGKIILIGIGIFYPLFINVVNATARLRASEFMDLVKIYRVKKSDVGLKIYGRGIVTDVLVGLKTSLGYGFTLIVVSEFSASRNGIGHFIWRAWDSFHILDMYAGVLWLCVLGWIVQAFLDQLLRMSIK